MMNSAVMNVMLHILAMQLLWTARCAKANETDIITSDIVVGVKIIHRLKWIVKANCVLSRSAGVGCCFHTQLKYLNFYSNLLEKSVCWIRTQLESDSTFENLLKSHSWVECACWNKKERLNSYSTLSWVTKFGLSPSWERKTARQLKELLS